MNDKQELVQRTERHEVAAANPQQMLMAAIEKGVDAESLGRMMDLQERWEANEARKAYTAAMSAFRAEAPVIRKNAEVDFTNKSGQRTNYRHASLDYICELVNPILAKHGLTYAWVTQQENGQATVHCDVTHVMGHKERVTLTGPYDQSGNKNSIQAIGSAVTYLQRYTLVSALGLATGGQDDDARSIEPEPEPIETITEDEALDVQAQCDEIGLPVSKLLEKVSRTLGFSVTRTRDIPAGTLPATLKYIEAKRAAQ